MNNWLHRERLFDAPPFVICRRSNCSDRRGVPMISLPTLALTLSGVGVAVTGTLAALFVRNPAQGMQQTTHHAEQLPQVMTGRYVALTLLALGATIHANMAVIAYLFAVFAFLGFVDAFIYARAHRPMAKHLIAGIAALIVAAVALAAHLNTGATL